MSNIDKIRQEIERRKKICENIFERESDTYYQGKAVAYGELLPFIDSLPDEHLRDSTKMISEDERIRKALIDGVRQIRCKNGITQEQMLAYLEKQKDLDKMIVVSPEVWDNAISDAYENGKKEGEKQKEQKVDIDKLRRDLYQSGYNDGYQHGKEDAQKEQKPVEYLSKDKVYAIMNKLTNLSYSNLIPFASEEYVKIHEITFDVRRLLDYPIEQKPAEWSEEDEKMLISIINDFAQGHKSSIGQEKWLKSLRPVSKESLQPHWKPSEEQMEALEYVIRDYREDSCNATANYLQEILDHLKNM